MKKVKDETRKKKKRNKNLYMEYKKLFLFYICMFSFYRVLVCNSLSSPKFSNQILYIDII